jgi:2-octaprenylphenol hydroxylase
MSYDVIVAGCGIMGLSTSLALAELGLSVACCDSRSLEQVSQATERVYALNQASINLLHQLKAWESLPASSTTPYRAMHVWVKDTGASLDFDARSLGRAQLGAIVLEPMLVQKLLNLVQASPHIQLFTESPVLEVQESAAEIQVMTSKTTLSARLFIICDGARSSLRDILHIPYLKRPYHHHAIVTTVQTEQPHQQSCYQIFTPEGPLAFLPLHDPHQSSIVWSVPPEAADALMSLSVNAWNEAITQTFQQHLGKVQRLKPLSRYPLIMRHVQQYVGQRWLIMGDAAHTVHPMAGLGLNLGLADLTTWLRVWDQYRWDRLSYALGAYQRERSFENAKVITLLDFLKWIFATPQNSVSTLRDWGLKLCQALPLLNQYLIEQAQMK